MELIIHDGVSVNFDETNFVEVQKIHKIYRP